MTSKSCYVYVQLPGSLEFTTCGRYEREELDAGGVVGRFVYGRQYRDRKDAVPLDPYGLPITDAVLQTTRLAGVHGALRDASPDKWGRVVLDRASGRPLDEFDYLLESPEDRFGAIAFGDKPDQSPKATNAPSLLQLAELENAARRLEAGERPQDLPENLKVLITPGTSLGGARPKAVVEDGNGLWVAKFPSTSDKWNNAAIEGAMLRLAARCDIQVPATTIKQVNGRSVLLVKRFDRKKTGGGYFRHRAISGLTAIGADESEYARWSYLLLSDELQRRSERPREDRVELYRRMVFNAVISNEDDHPRNHALIAPGQGWFLAPAFDLTPKPSYSEQRRLAMICGSNENRAATRANLLSESQRFGLPLDEARGIIDEIKAIVSAEWETEVRACGGSAQDCDEIKTAFKYDGFEY